jgi:hypothetical protein
MCEGRRRCAAARTSTFALLRHNFAKPNPALMFSMGRAGKMKRSSWRGHRGSRQACKEMYGSRIKAGV